MKLIRAVLGTILAMTFICKVAATLVSAWNPF